MPEIEWIMGEFFILEKFQNQGIGQQVVHHVWRQFSGVWEVTVIPENTPALHFWRKAVVEFFTDNTYTDTTIDVTFDQHQPP